MKMQMEPDDVVSLYREASSKTKQIQILAELNACSCRDIAELLAARGEQLPKFWADAITKARKPGRKPGQLKKAEPAAEAPAAADPRGDPAAEPDPKTPRRRKAGRSGDAPVTMAELDAAIEKALAPRLPPAVRSWTLDEIRLACADLIFRLPNVGLRGEALEGAIRALRELQRTLKEPGND